MGITLETLRPCLSFDGNGYVEVSTAVKNIINKNSQYTIEFFARATVSGRVHQLFQYGYTSTDRHGLTFDSSGRPTFNYYDGTWKAVKGNVVPWGEFAHIAVVFNTYNDIKIYVNTRLGSPGDRTYTYPYTNITIARDSYYNKDGLIGEIAYVRIYNRLLSEGEIQHNYNNPDNPIRNGLALWFKVNEGSGNILYDASGNNNNGLATNASWTTFWRNETSRLIQFRHSLTSRELEKIEFTLIHTDLDIGQRVRAKRDGNIFFEGIIYERRKRHDQNYMSVEATAYTDLILFDRHVVYRLYEAGTRAGDIIRDLASLEQGVNVDEVDDGPQLLTNWEIQNQTALEVMKSVARGTNYWLRMRPGKRLVFRPKAMF